MYMKINISNSSKAAFRSLSTGEIFLINGSDVGVKIDYESNTWNAWNFRAKDLQMMDDNAEVIIPKEVSMEVIL